MEQAITDFNPIYVYIVYAITWILLFGYLYYLGKKQQSIRSEIQALQNILESSKN